ncbi:MAG: hypothetical protein ACHQ9S_11195 [Candidatus Binatia bacterium]
MHIRSRQAGNGNRSKCGKGLDHDLDGSFMSFSPASLRNLGYVLLAFSFILIGVGLGIIIYGLIFPDRRWCQMLLFLLGAGLFVCGELLIGSALDHLDSQGIERVINVRRIGHQSAGAILAVWDKRRSEQWSQTGTVTVWEVFTIAPRTTLNWGRLDIPHWIPGAEPATSGRWQVDETPWCQFRFVAIPIANQTKHVQQELGAPVVQFPNGLRGLWADVNKRQPRLARRYYQLPMLRFIGGSETWGGCCVPGLGTIDDGSHILCGMVPNVRHKVGKCKSLIWLEFINKMCSFDNKHSGIALSQRSIHCPPLKPSKERINYSDTENADLYRYRPSIFRFQEAERIAQFPEKSWYEHWQLYAGFIVFVVGIGLVAIGFGTVVLLGRPSGLLGFAMGAFVMWAGLSLMLFDSPVAIFWGDISGFSSGAAPVPCAYQLPSVGLTQCA